MDDTQPDRGHQATYEFVPHPRPDWVTQEILDAAERMFAACCAEAGYPQPWGDGRRSDGEVELRHIDLDLPRAVEWKAKQLVYERFGFPFTLIDVETRERIEHPGREMEAAHA